MSNEVSIPGLDNQPAPALTDLLEISQNPGSFNISISQLSDFYQLITEKGAANGYAGLDASQELLIANFPSGTGLQILRRNSGNTALEFFTLTDLQGVTSINADTTAAQIIAAGTGLGIVDTGATHTLSIDSTVATLTGTQTLTNKTITAAANTITIASTDLTDSTDLVRNNAATTYTAGVRQDFLGLLAGTSGLNVGGIAGNPTTQVNGDIWLNTSTNQIFGRINGVDVDLGAAAGGTPPFTDTNSIVEGSADASKELRFEVDGNTTSIIGVIATIFTTAKTITIPDATDTLVGLATTDTLTNKTLTEPRFADLGFIADANGNEMLVFDLVASAVNFAQLANSAVGNQLSLSALGTDTNIDFRFIPKGTGTFYGVRETFAWPLTDETTLPTTGVKYTTEPAPYDMTIEDAIMGLTTAGTGGTLFSIDILKETGTNTDSFTTIFSTLPTTDASEFTSTTAATPPVISVSTWEKGRRLQLSISAIDSNSLGRGAKIELLIHATAK